MIIISRDYHVILAASAPADAPVIGQHNLVTTGNISATTEDEDFPAVNLANPNTALYWQAGDNPSMFSFASQFDDAYWTKVRSSISVNATSAPDGTTDADKLIEDATATNTHSVSRSITFVAGRTYELSIYAKASTRSVIALQVPSTAFIAGMASTNWFNLSAGTVSKTSGPGTPTITAVGNGWYLCKVVFTPTISVAVSVVFYLDNSPTGTAVYSGDGVSGLFIWKAELYRGLYLTVTTNYVDDTDYVGIARHNFGTIAATVSVEARSGVGDWAEIVEEFIPADDAPLILRYTPETYTEVRVKIQPVAGTVPYAAVLYVGKLLPLQRNIYVDHRPITYSRNTEVFTGVSESGNYLGRVVLKYGNDTALALRNLTPLWYRNSLDPVIVQMQSRPIFFAWRPQTYPLEVGYAWLPPGANPKPFNQRANGMMGIDIPLDGIA